MILTYDSKNVLLDRFMENVLVNYETGCWQWMGYATCGYGQLYADGRTQKAHRFIYETRFGKIPKGLTIDHLCRNRMCVNPFHMEIATYRENALRGIGPSAQNARKTHCIRGRELPSEAIYNRWRYCKQCKIEMQRIRRNQKRASS